MNSIPAVVEKHIRLSVEHANRLNRLAEIHQIREDQIIERALQGPLASQPGLSLCIEHRSIRFYHQHYKKNCDT